MCHSIASFARALWAGADLEKSKNKKQKDFVEKLFLCLEALAVDEDLVDLDLDEVLTVPLHLLVLLLALELEDEYLVAAAFADDGGENLGSGEIRLELALFGADGEDVGELKVAVLVGGGFDLQLLAGRDEVLFAAGADDCVHD
jgi:hypothetical protein